MVAPRLDKARSSGTELVVFSSRTSSLSDADDRWLKDGLGQALPDLRMAELFAVRPELFHETDHLVVAVATETGQAVGALGSKQETTADGRPFLHIGVQFVGTQHRSGAIFAASWARLLGEVIATDGFPWRSALRTYNPVAYCAMRHYGEVAGATMFPRIPAAGQEHTTSVLAGEIARVLAPRALFDPETGLLHGIGVPRDLYRNRPSCRDPEVNRYFAQHAQPGDRVLCVVEVLEQQTADAIVRTFLHRQRPTHTPPPNDGN